MPKRIKKPPVKPETRLEWLKRVEQGETPLKIAESDGVDVRTVRKHVELARMERDVQKARSDVLRNALESHYQDLLDTAQNIGNQISRETSVLTAKERPLMLGLHQHMPRSPLWENLRRWNRTITELAELEEMINTNVERDLEADGRLSVIFSKRAKGVIPTTVDVLVYQVKKWARGQEGLNIDRDIHIEKATEGLVMMKYGFSHFGEIDESSVETIRAVLVDFESELRNRPEYLEMEKLYNRLGRLKDSINEVLTVVLLRRIVPGKCKFCPL
jgi:hypothetical protein